MISTLSFREYLALDRASSHSLWKLFSKSPLSMRAERAHPKPPTNEMSLGTILHALLAGSKIVVQPKTANRKSNEGKTKFVSWLEKVTGHPAPRSPTELQSKGSKLDYKIKALQDILKSSEIEFCSQEQYEAAQRMQDSLMSKKIVREICKAGKPEVSVLQTDPETGMEMKSRFDWLPDHYAAVVDWKSTRSVRHSIFSADCARYGYHLQAAMYSWMYDMEFGQWPTFFFIAVESEWPYDSSVFEADEAFIETGLLAFREAIEIYSKCKKQGFWPGSDWDWEKKESSIQKLSLPKWVHYD